jgi:hypothetical protein
MSIGFNKNCLSRTDVGHIICLIQVIMWLLWKFFYLQESCSIFPIGQPCAACACSGLKSLPDEQPTLSSCLVIDTRSIDLDSGLSHSRTILLYDPLRVIVTHVSSLNEFGSRASHQLFKFKRDFGNVGRVMAPKRRKTTAGGRGAKKGVHV